MYIRYIMNTMSTFHPVSDTKRILTSSYRNKRSKLYYYLRTPVNRIVLSHEFLLYIPFGRVSYI